MHSSGLVLLIPSTQSEDEIDSIVDTNVLLHQYISRWELSVAFGTVLASNTDTSSTAWLY